MFEYKNNVCLFGAVLLVVFAVSAGVRYQQFETWKKTPQSYFIGERPMMTTLDAPYWLRWAREFNEGVFGQKNRLNGYPGGRSETFRKILIPYEFKDPPTTSSPSTSTSTTPSSSSTSSPSSSGTPEINHKNVPLLSFLIAHLAPFFDNNYYLAGTLLIPVLASLFILPLGFYFFWIGLPVSGLLGGLIGTFAGGYYMRSSIGRIDTDMLNLFFSAAGGFVGFAGRKSKKGTECYALFYWHWIEFVFVSMVV